MLFTMVDESSASYAAGQFIGQLLMAAGVIALLVWAVVRSRRDRALRAGGPPPNVAAAQAADLAALGRFVALHAGDATVAALVARVLGQHPLIVPATGPTPAWQVRADTMLFLTLVPDGQGAAVLRVAEVEVPLRSPQAAAAWTWVLSTVTTEATSAGVHVTTGQRHLVPSRPIGPLSAMWAPV